MSFDAMLNHKCDVYHIIKTDSSPGYSLPASPVFSYGETPDIVGLSCHFGVRNSVAVTVTQKEPFAVYDTRIKLTVPLGTDIRLNDKVINTAGGLEYTADFPSQIRKHHITVMLRRTEAQKAI